MEKNKKATISAPAIHRIRALIIDDERGAIRTLGNMLQAYCPQIQVSGTATSVPEAREQAISLQPDLVFLDIEMPPVGSGFDFLKSCGEESFGVIFTTAYPQYAIQAINTIQPWAYLVKPFSVTELMAAVAVAAEKMAHLRHAAIASANQQKIILHDSRKGIIVLRAADIAYCQADGSFTDFIMWKNNRVEKVTASRPLGEFESELSPLLFCRTHHGFIVNMNHVEQFERTGRNGLIHLKNMHHLAKVSVSRMEGFLKHLNNPL